MYGREYSGQTYTLEASGGLIHSSLVMQDRETSSYWSLMRGEVIGGKLKGQKIVELPVGEKMRWRDWVQKYPATLVLSVNGREDAPEGYRGYFTSPEGFRGETAADDRLPTKEPVFAFRHAGQAYAVPHSVLQGGKSYDLPDGKRIFLHRPYGADLFESTDAFMLDGKFAKTRGQWIIIGSDCRFDTATGAFISPQNAACAAEILPGFDTFWYNWSLNNPGVRLLGVTQ